MILYLLMMVFAAGLLALRLRRDSVTLVAVKARRTALGHVIRQQ